MPDGMKAHVDLLIKERRAAEQKAHGERVEARQRQTAYTNTQDRLYCKENVPD